MVERQLLTVLGQQGFDLGQVEDALCQLVKFSLTHVFYGWRNVLHDSALNNEPTRPFLALAVLQILNLLLNTLVFMFLLAQLLFKFGALFK